MVDISGTFKKLRDFYGNNLNFTNIKYLNIGISIIIILTVFAGHIFKFQGITVNLTFISISDEWKSAFVIVVILHLYGLTKFSQEKIKESILTPEIEVMNCPKCKIPMITYILKCPQCGKTF